MALRLVAMVAWLAAAFAGAGAAQSAPPARRLITNARIYTEDAQRPWAQTMVTEGNRLAYVGDLSGARAYCSRGCDRVDLGGATVLPGLIDAHTHPGMVAILGSGDPIQDRATQLPTGSKAGLFRWLATYARTHRGQNPIILGSWDVATFLPEGPNRRDLDRIFNRTPVVLLDNSGHSQWVNTAMLEQLGVNRSTPDISPGLSIFVRDSSGELTGWVKEFALLQRLGPALLPPDREFRARLRRQIGYLSSHGITSLVDAGNLNLDDPVYRALSDLDRAGDLPIRYHGSYHIWDPRQLDSAVARLEALRARYGGPRLKFDTIKIHFDGVNEILTAAQLAHYATDSTARGATLVDRDRLVKFILELDQRGIMLHLHTDGDRAAREALDAVEKARQTRGGPLAIEVTMSHLETVDPTDIPRFRALDVTANFTPHWFAGTAFGRAGRLTLGPERAGRQQMVGSLVRAGANVSLSSDVVSSDEVPRSNPFVGLEMAVTRQEYTGAHPLQVPPLIAERLTVAQAVDGYTMAGARQLGQAGELGSLAAGKLADFIVLDHNPFEVPASSLHRVRVRAVVVDGVLVHGTLGRRPTAP